MSHPPGSFSKTRPSQDVEPVGGREARHNAFLDACESKLNRYANGLAIGDPKDRCKAAYREQQGEVISVKPDGTPHNHVKKVQNIQGGLKKTIAGLQDVIGDPTLSRHQKIRAQRLLSRSSKMLDYSEHLIPSTS